MPAHLSFIGMGAWRIDVKLIKSQVRKKNKHFQKRIKKNFRFSKRIIRFVLAAPNKKCAPGNSFLLFSNVGKEFRELENNN